MLISPCHCLGTFGNTLDGTDALRKNRVASPADTITPLSVLAPAVIAPAAQARSVRRQEAAAADECCRVVRRRGMQ